MLRVFIIGTTGVGKTKLSIELAKYLKGEVISSDSKQLYRHASIMTAKVTPEEAEGVPHHMVDVLQLHQNAYNRNKYFTQAFTAMQEIESRGKTPIIVGGTNYYTETLLYYLAKAGTKVVDDDDDEAYNSNEEEGSGDKQASEQQKAKLEQMRGLSKEEKYELLKQYDSLIAEKVHRNNEQKITLFLERIIRNNCKISDNYQQHTHLLRSNNTLVFWLRNSNKEELLGMVTKRIHKMLDKAGITEILAVYHYLHLHRASQHAEQPTNYEDYSGAASSIGIKEFLPLYLEMRQQMIALLPVQPNHEIGYQQIHSKISQHFDQLKYSPETLAKCTEQLIMDTKHYCKRQITWIRNRMFLHNQTARQHFFVLDLMQPEGQEEPLEIMQRFQLQIKQKAIQIIESVRQHGFGHTLQQEEHFADSKAVALEEWKNFYCDACKVEINGEFDWGYHLKSKRHIKQVKYEEKKQERAEHVAKQKALAKERREKKEKPAEQDQKVGDKEKDFGKEDL